MLLSKLVDVNEKLYQIKELWSSIKDDLSKQEKPKKVLVIHDLDLDGYVGGAMAYKLYTAMLGEEAVQRIGVTSGKPFKTYIEDLVLQDRNFSETMLVVIDHVLLPEVLHELGKRFKYVNWFDHHPLDEEKVKLHDFNFDTLKFVLCITPNNCSAMCFFQTAMSLSISESSDGEFFNAAYLQNLYNIVAAVDIYDRWLWPAMLEEKMEGINEHIPSAAQVTKAQDAVGLNTWFYMQDDPWTKIREMIECDNLNHFFDSVTVGWEFHQLQEKEALQIAKKNVAVVNISRVSDDKTSSTWKAGVVFHSSNISNLAKKVLDLYPDMSMVLVIYAKGNSDDLRVSVRTRDGSEVTAEEFAKLHGGGGHKNAAGFHAPLEKILGFLSESILKV